MAVLPADLPPEFAAVDPATAQYWIDIAACEVDDAAWICAGVDPDKGVNLLAAHKLKQAGEGTSTVTGAAVIASQSVGGVSVSAQTGTAADGPHAGSLYGRSYDAILNRVNAAPRCSFGSTPQPCL